MFSYEPPGLSDCDRHLAPAGHPRRDIAIRAMYNAVSGFALTGHLLAGSVHCRCDRRSDYFEHGSRLGLVPHSMVKRLERSL